MAEEIHPNYVIASYIFFASIGVGIINFIIGNGLVVPPGVLIVTYLILVWVALIMRRGYKNFKYVLLALLALGTLLSVPALIIYFDSNRIICALSVAQVVLQAWCVVLLFKVPKNTLEFDEHDYSRPDVDSFEN